MSYAWTGERLETFITNEIMTEHLHRYAMALEMSEGKNVLDIACGEGYGANLLASRSSAVTAVDADPLTISRAKEKYKPPNIQFITGSILDIPVPDHSVDLVTCFETLEHLEEHEKMMQEVKRVLKPDGILLISTPDKKIYSDSTGYKNPHHKKELYGDEFKDLVNGFFSHTVFYRQVSGVTSFITSGDNDSSITYQTGDYKNISRITPVPYKYWLAIASNREFRKSPSGLFCNPKTVQQICEDECESVKRTITYRTGNFLLYPFKLIQSLLKK